MIELAYAVAGLAGAVGFVETFLRLGTPHRLEKVLRVCRQASSVLLSSRISDHWKERAIPAYSLAILRATAIATLQLLAALAVFVVLAGIIAAIFGAGLDATLFLNWPLNIAALVGGAFYAYLRPPETTSNDYGLASRWLHRIALGPAAIREVAFDLDQSIGQAVKPADATIAAGAGNHVFVCGLARAGTSILFRTLYATGEFETLSYRDMPFVLAPRLWRMLARSHGRAAVERERAHKDGLSVSFDSPEAFEEVFWLTFAGDDYVRPDRLLQHTAEEETVAQFRRYVAAILASSPGGAKSRYLSKNNNNLLRLNSIREAFPQAAIVLPFRQPVDHAQSLWRQHRNFCKQQTDDAFARQYMGWLGHYEFGLDHRPFVLDAGARPQGDPNTPRYWLEYWICVYQAILTAAAPATIFFNYDVFCAAPAKTLSALAEQLGLHVATERLAADIRPSSNYSRSRAPMPR